MSAPQLTRQLDLQDPQRTPDGAGGFVETWVTLGTLWAAVDAGTGRARRDGVAPVSAVSLQIVVRGAPQGSSARPKAGQRFREGSRFYTISAVAERDANGRYLVCHATEEVVA